MPRKVYGGLHRNGTLRSSTIKKVAPPTVPDLTNNNPPLAAGVPQPAGTLVAISTGGANVGGGLVGVQASQGNQVPLNRLSCYSTGSSGSSHSSGGSSVATFDCDSVVYQSTTAIHHHLHHQQQPLYHTGQPQPQQQQQQQQTSQQQAAQQQQEQHHIGSRHPTPPMCPLSPEYGTLKHLHGGGGGGVHLMLDTTTVGVGVRPRSHPGTPQLPPPPPLGSSVGITDSHRHQGIHMGMSSLSGACEYAIPPGSTTLGGQGGGPIYVMGTSGVTAAGSTNMNNNLNNNVVLSSSNNNNTAMTGASATMALLHHHQQQQQQQQQQQGAQRVASGGATAMMPPGAVYPSTGGDVRNSSSSLDSGRGSSSSGSESSSFTSTTGNSANNNNNNNNNKESAVFCRLSLGVCSGSGAGGSATSLSLMSSCSSTSSNGDNSPSPNGQLQQQLNVAHLLLNGIPDQEVLSLWLKNLHFEEYLPLFVNSGYDMPTISRMTPEDLTAIGITRPQHRRKLKQEISKLNISDGIPDYKPDNLLLWLKLLRLDEYAPALAAQGYTSIDKLVAELAWEDLEEIGILKLGHQKKLMLAIKKVKGQKGLYGPLPGVAQNAGMGQSLGPSNNNNNNQTPITITRHPSLDMGNPHARPVTVPVPPNQYEALNQPGRMVSFLNNRGGALRTVGSGSDLQRMDNEDQQLYMALELNNQKNQRATGRSLESLQNDMYTYQQQDLNGGSGWRQNQFDHQMGGGSYEPMEGTATLNRPRGLVKPRPVAKVTGTSTTSLRDALNDDDDADASLAKDSNNLKGVGSNGQQGGATTPGAMSKRILAPLPPAKPPLSAGVVGVVGSGSGSDALADTAFATCVQSLTSRFTLATLGGDREDKDDALPAVPPPMNATLRSISKINQITAQTQAQQQLQQQNPAQQQQSPPGGAGSGKSSHRGTVEEMNKANIAALAGAHQMTAGLITDRQDPPSPPQRDYPATPTTCDQDQTRLPSSDTVPANSNGTLSSHSINSSSSSKVHNNNNNNNNKSNAAQPQSYPSPVLHSQANSIISQVKRQDSNSSLTSDCGIPFANENVGTIKQKPPHPPTPDYEPPQQAASAHCPSTKPLLTSPAAATAPSGSSSTGAAGPTAGGGSRSPPRHQQPVAGGGSAVTFEMCSTLPRRAKPPPPAADMAGGTGALIPSDRKKSFADSPLLRRSQSARSRELALPELTPPPPPAPHPPLPPLPPMRGAPTGPVGASPSSSASSSSSSSSSSNMQPQTCATSATTGGSVASHKVAVIDDIEHMLASLTDQLDAMLDHSA